MVNNKIKCKTKDSIKRQCLCMNCFSEYSFVENVCSNVSIDLENTDLILNVKDVYIDLSYSMFCPKCDSGNVQIIDDGIIGYIKYLNKNNIKTIFSCEGHYYDDNNYSNSYILFDKSMTNILDIIINKYPEELNIPDEWNFHIFNREDYDDNHNIIEEKVYTLECINKEFIKSGKHLHSLGILIPTLVSLYIKETTS